jgi:hypothetical protein
MFAQKHTSPIIKHEVVSRTNSSGYIYLHQKLLLNVNSFLFYFRDLSYNDLTGELPEFLAQLPNLKTL